MNTNENKTEKKTYINVTNEYQLYVDWKNKGYTMVDGELTLCNIIANKMTPTEIIPVVEVDGKKIELPNGTRFYESVEDYENGDYIKYYGNRSLRQFFPYEVNLVTDAEGTPCITYWHMVNGEPTKVTIYAEELYLPVFGSKEKVLINGKELPTDVYESEQSCIAWNDYVVNENGVKTERISKKRKTLPTKEQLKLMENLVDAIKKATDSGLYVCFDDNMNLYAYNMDAVADHEFDCVDPNYQEGAIEHIVYGVNKWKMPKSVIYQGDCYLIVNKWKEDKE